MKRIRIKNTNTNGEVLKTITMPRNMYMEVYEAVSGQDFKKDQLVEDIIKVEGVTYDNSNDFATKDNGKVYEYQISTPAQMRASVSLYKDKERAKEFGITEDILCGGKYNDIELATDSYLKDLLSKLSLGLTGAEKVDIPVITDGVIDNNKLNVIIAKDIDFTVTKPVKMLKDGLTNEQVAKGIDVFDYEVKKIEQTAFDGAGIITPLAMEAISKACGLDYTMAWCTIRSFMGIKGLLTCVDLEAYMRDYHNGKNTIVDYKGVERIITPMTIVVNESMAKLSKWFNGIEDYDRCMKAKGYDKYQHITDRIWVVKKANKYSKQVAETSYQMLNLLKISKPEMEQLASENKNFLEKVRAKDKSACLEFVGLNAKPLSNIEEDEDYEVQSKDDKLYKMLSCEFDEFIKVPAVQHTLEQNILRKTKNHLAGKFLLQDSSFKIIAPDAILFMNYLAKQEFNEYKGFKIENLNQIVGGLATRTWYIKGEEGMRFTGRYPMAGFFELSNEQLVQSKLHERYCLYNNEIVTVNMRGTELMEKSGADCDGDLLFVSKNKILMNSVIKSDVTFINKNELEDNAKKIEIKFSKGKEFRKRMNLQLSKNYIGALAIGSSTLGDYCQSLTFTELGSNEYNLSASELFERYKGNMDLINRHMYLGNAPIEKQKELIEKRMKSKEALFCLGVSWQMLVIDAPKKGTVIDEEAINDFLRYVNNEGKRPQFFPLLKDKETSKIGSINSVLSDYMLWNRYLLFKPVSTNKDEGCQVLKNLFFYAQKGSFIEDDVQVIARKIANNYRDYQIEVKNIMDEWEDNVAVASCISNYGYFTFDEAEKIKSDRFDKLSIKHSDKSIELYNNYSKDSICEAIRRWLNSTSNKYYSKYIIDYYFYAIEALMGIKPTISVLVESDEGTVNLFKPYVIKEIPTPKNFYNDNITIVQAQRVERTVSKGFNGRYGGNIKLSHNSTIIIKQELTSTNVYQWLGNVIGAKIGTIHSNQLDKVKEFIDIPVVVESFTNGNDKEGNIDVNFMQVIIRKV